MTRSSIEDSIRESIATKERLLADGLGPVEALLRLAGDCIEAGGRLFFCGNGGSACDAAHAACELIGWFVEKNRGPLPAIALGHETPTATAIANDKGYEQVFARQLRGLGRRGDLLVGITTSGSSENVLRAIQTAKELGATAVALTGSRQGRCAEQADLWVPVPSEETPRIQESHLLVVHLLCAYLEDRFSA
ncbi:MAG: SIS domain-containing protein [Planctomycetota bacterium]